MERLEEVDADFVESLFVRPMVASLRSQDHPMARPQAETLAALNELIFEQLVKTMAKHDVVFAQYHPVGGLL